MKNICLRNEVELDSGKYNVEYIFNLEPFHCAKYTRIQAEKLFGLKFPEVDAWNLPYHCDSKMYLKEYLRPGNILLCENPTSKFNGTIDSNGDFTNTTHTALYLGNNTLDEEIFIHQFNLNQEIISLEEILSYPLNPKRILSINNNF